MGRLTVWKILVVLLSLAALSGCAELDLSGEEEIDPVEDEVEDEVEDSGEGATLSAAFDVSSERPQGLEGPVEVLVVWSVEGLEGGGLSSLTLYGAGEELPASASFYEDPLRVLEAPSRTGSVVLEVFEEPLVLRGHAESEDGRSAWSAAYEVVLEAGEPPVADAGPDQTVRLDGGMDDAVVRLNGSASNGTGGPSKSFVWYRMGLGGERIEVGTGEEMEVELGLGDYTFELVVTDAVGRSASDGVVVQVQKPGAPVAQMVRDDGEGLRMSDVNGSGYVWIPLNASGSSSPDGEIVSYAWFVNQEQVGEGPTASVNISLEGQSARQQAVTVVVNDEFGLQDSLTRTVTVEENQPPVATLSHDIPEGIVTANVDRTLELAFDASASHDPDGAIASYAWAVTADHDEAVGSGDNMTHGFTVPSGVEEVQYTVEVTIVDEAGAVDSASAVFTLEETGNVPPIAAMEVECTYLVCTLDGSGSFDPVPGQTISEGEHVWEIEDPHHIDAGENDRLGRQGPVVEHRFSEPGTYQVNLSVRDVEGLPDEVTELVTVSGVSLLSPSFDEGDDIPPRHTCQGSAVTVRFDMGWYSGPSHTGYPTGLLRETSDISPGLQIQGIDADATESLVVFMYDRDASDPVDPDRDFNNWVAWDIPANATNVTIPEGQLSEQARVGENSFGHAAYLGPCPSQNLDNRYEIVVHALDAPLDLPEGTSFEEVEAALESVSVLEGASLAGVFNPGCVVDTAPLLAGIQPLGLKHVCVNVRPEELQEEVFTATVPQTITFGSNKEGGAVPSNVQVTWADYRVSEDGIDPDDPLRPHHMWNTTLLVGQAACLGLFCYEDVDEDHDGVPDLTEPLLCFFIEEAKPLAGDEDGVEALGSCRNGDYAPPVQAFPWPLEVTLIPSDPMDLVE